MISEDAIIYEDHKEHIYMISEGKGYITRKATIEDLLSMNQARIENGLNPVEYRLDWVSRTNNKPIEDRPRRLSPCPNCGANSWVNHICEYCGTEV